MARQKFKVKIENKKIAVFLAVFGAIALGAWGFVFYTQNFAPVTVADFEGTPVQFRTDLREAQKVDVLPSEDALRAQIVKPPKVEGPNGQFILRSPLKGAIITFKPVDSGTNGWYSVQVTEIIKKLTILYQGKYDRAIGFNVTEVQEYGQVEGDNLIPVIELVHPDYADGTFVSVDSDRNVITISGGDSLRDFDLATVRFMTVALGIEV